MTYTECRMALRTLSGCTRFC